MKRLMAAGFTMSLIWPSASWADPILVRSGEHENFTRIVLPLPDGAVWELKSTPGNSQLIFENHDAGFDLSEAFEVIPRTRLAALLAQDSVLEMQLACDCPVTAFVEQDAFLVLDIADGVDLVQGPPQEVRTSQPPVSEFSYGELLWRNADPQSDEPGSVAQDLADVPSDAQPNNEVTMTAPELVLETQTRLLEAFSEAASRGLLDPAQPLQPIPPEPERERSEPEIYDSSQRLEVDRPPVAGNLRVSNSKDVPQDSAISDMALSGAVCLDPKLVDVTSWADDSPFSTQLGQLHQELFDEVGRLEKSTAIELAKFYLHYGFGAEARQTLSLVPDLTNGFPELLDLANIFEYGFAQNPRSLHRFADCNSDVALWGFLAAEEFPEDYAVDAKAVLRGLQNLPSHLRYLFGPGLSDRFLERGDAESANLALRSFESLLENEGKPPKIAEAQAQLTAGADKEAQNTLNEIIEEDTPDAPEAIIRLIQQLVDEDKPVPADIALLAESYSFELQDSPEGDEMLRASVLAFNKSAQFEKSLAILEDSQSPFDVPHRTTLASHLIGEISKNADDAEFLNLYFTRFPGVKGFANADSRLALAQRLQTMGFMEEADELLESLPVAYKSEELSLLRARILLKKRQYQESLDELTELDGPEISKLRGEALELLGQNEEAAKSFESANLPDRAASSLWLASDWLNLVDENTPIFGTMSQLTNDEPLQISADDQMLTKTEAALSASAEARSALEETLRVLELTEE